MEKHNSILVIDWGTTKVHTNIISLEDGSKIAGSSLEYSDVADRVIGQGLEPEVVWLAAQQALEPLLENTLPSQINIAAISFSVFAYCAIAADANYAPLSSICYGMDTRCAHHLELLKQRIPDDEYSNIAGCRANMLQIHSKLMWLQDTLPERPEKYLTLQQYVLKKLGLEPVSDYSSAAQGIMDLRTGTLSQQMLEATGTTAEMFGKILDSATVVGHIAAFGKVKLPYSIPVVLGAHDAVCGMLGLGMPPYGNDGILVDCAGTADLIGICGKFKNTLTPTCDIFATAGVAPGSCCYHAGPASGVVMEWFAKNMCGISVSDAIELAKFDPESKVRVHVNDSTMQVDMNNMSVATDFGQVFTALTEDLAFITKDYSSKLEHIANTSFGKMRIGASGATSDYQVQLKADVLGMPVERVANLEVSSVGAAIIAAVAIGYYDDYSQAIEHMVKVERTFTPDFHRHEIYTNRHNHL